MQAIGATDIEQASHITHTKQTQLRLRRRGRCAGATVSTACLRKACLPDPNLLRCPPAGQVVEWAIRRPADQGGAGGGVNPSVLKSLRCRLASGTYAVLQGQPAQGGSISPAAGRGRRGGGDRPARMPYRPHTPCRPRLETGSAPTAPPTAAPQPSTVTAAARTSTC